MSPYLSTNEYADFVNFIHLFEKCFQDRLKNHPPPDSSPMSPPPVTLPTVLAHKEVANVQSYRNPRPSHHRKKMKLSPGTGKLTLNEFLF